MLPGHFGQRMPLFSAFGHQRAHCSLEPLHSAHSLFGVWGLDNPTTQNPGTRICVYGNKEPFQDCFNSSRLKADTPFAFPTCDWLPLISPKLSHLDLDTRQLQPQDHGQDHRSSSPPAVRSLLSWIQTKTRPHPPPGGRSGLPPNPKAWPLRHGLPSARLMGPPRRSSAPWRRGNCRSIQMIPITTATGRTMGEFPRLGRSTTAPSPCWMEAKTGTPNSPRCTSSST